VHQPGTGKTRFVSAGAATQMSDTGGDVRDAAQVDHVIAQQLNDQLEGAVEQRRMQVILIRIASQRGFELEHCECAPLFEPAVTDRAEGRSVVQSGSARQQLVAARTKVRLAGGQLSQRALQPQ